MYSDWAVYGAVAISQHFHHVISPELNYDLPLLEKSFTIVYVTFIVTVLNTFFQISDSVVKRLKGTGDFAGMLHSSNYTAISVGLCSSCLSFCFVSFHH